MGDSVTTVETLDTVAVPQFDSNPFAQTPVVDPMKPVPVNEMNKPQPIPVLEVAPEEDLSKLSEAERKEKEDYQKILEYDGYTESQKKDQMNSELPQGVTVDSAAKKGITLKDLDRDLLRVKDKLKSGDKGYKPNIVMSSLEFMKKASAVVDIKAYKKFVDDSKLLGFDFTDGVTESAVSIGVIEAILQKSSKSNVWDIIEGTIVEKIFKDWIVGEVLDLAAKYGSYTSVRAIIENYSDSVGDAKRKKCIGKLMAGFRIGDEKDDILDDGEIATAKRIVADFDHIYPGWEIYLKSFTLKDQSDFTKANKDFLSLMSFHMNSTNPSTNDDGVDSRKINIAAKIQLDKGFVIENYIDAFNKAQPNIVT